MRTSGLLVGKRGKVKGVKQEEVVRYRDLLLEAERRSKTNIIAEYKPYVFQGRFHEDGGVCSQRVLMCANQGGKSTTGAAEDAFHLTGLYPEWWKGARFKKPVLMWVCGQTNDKVRDTMQKKLFGEPFNEDLWGTGFVPLKCLSVTENKRVRKAGVPNAWQAVMVKHFTDGVHDGWSTCVLKAYEAGYKVFTSEQVDVIHLDEEPPENIMTQCVVRQVAVQGGILYMTFTPEEGNTLIVEQFTNRLQKGQSLVNATWDDAPHLTLEKREQILAALPPHERDMRTRGIPLLGTGLIFPVNDGDIMCDPFELPGHYRFIAGLDIGGWNHWTAAVWVAYNADNDTIYVYDTYKAQGQTPPMHAAALNARGKDIVIIYPHDAEKGDRQTGSAVAQQYRDLGCNMNYRCFGNPPPEGQEEGGVGALSVDSGLLVMLTRMETGRFKVFKHLKDWFEEKRMYHRIATKDGRSVIVRNNEDLMSATRYAAQSLRFANVRKRNNQKSSCIAYETSYNPFVYGGN